MTPTPRILHVDDDAANRYAVTRSLKKAGFDVVEAANGTDALRLVKTKPDLVILDVRLPDIDGFEVCRRIKADRLTAGIPVLHLSANRISGEDKAIGLNGGADGYLVRPVEPVELIATVHALLRVRRTEAALQEREQQFKALLDGVREYAIFAVDTEGRIASWHEGAVRMTGYSAEQAIGMPFEKLYPFDEQGRGLAENEMRVAGETGEFKTEGVRKRRDGTLFDAEIVLTATRSATGELLGFLKLVQNITARKLVDSARETQLAAEQAARVEAERVGRMKDEFLATLSHEIRTPLNAIMGWSQIMKRPGVAADEIAQGLEVIERNARAQAQIVDDLLDMSRIISGNIRLDMQPMDVAAVVRAAMEATAPAADAKGIRLWATPVVDATAIYGDASRLQQVFWNLLTNAIKFTPRNGEVRVTVRQMLSSVRVDVADTGEGIDPAFLPHVFDRFRQADASTTRRHGGLGIGLSIVKQLAELHGGGVTVVSPGLGHGTVFSVTLPIAAVQYTAADEPGDPDRPAMAESVVSPECAAAVDGLNVLVVDDEPDARGLVRHLLERCGAHVTLADSAAAAYDLLRTGGFDVLVSDIGMPDADGYSLVRRLRAGGDRPGTHVPAVALTAYARSEDREKATTAGFQSHVTKPVEASKLITEVARVAGRGSDTGER